MSTDQMIEQFRNQQKEVVEEIKNLENTINIKKEDYFKLQGAIEALELIKERESEGVISPPSEEITSQFPPGYIQPSLNTIE